MSQFVVYIQLEKYLAQWITHEFGGSQPLQVPRGSAESEILEMFLNVSPNDYTPPEINENTVAVALPYFKNKDVRYYNYLPPKAHKALARCIYVRFRVQMWKELHSLDKVGISITDMIYAWMEKHGIDDDPKNWETIRQMYMRKRKIYELKNSLNRSDFTTDF